MIEVQTCINIEHPPKYFSVLLCMYSRGQKGLQGEDPPSFNHPFIHIQNHKVKPGAGVPVVNVFLPHVIGCNVNHLPVNLLIIGKNCLP